MTRLARISAAVATGAALFAASAAMASDLGPLVTPSELNAEIDTLDPVLLDIRTGSYEKGHIDGAVYAPYSLFRGPDNNPGQVPPIAKLQASFEQIGLEPDRPIVIIAQGDTDTDFGAAARVYWTLKSTGFTELSILNGGTTAWANAGLPMSDVTENLMPTDLDLTWNDRWTAETPAVSDVVNGKGKAVLVDARPPAFFEGKKAHSAASRPGTLPGAENLPYTKFFRSGATVIDAKADAAALKEKLGIKDGEEVVSFCNTGHWAATDWFAMSELAGIDNVKLYPGSMVEYSQTDGKMANTPGLLQNLLNQLTGG
ncbi:sulfurtransferase [Thioclava nitratireducens]|uniref:Sulfurtransferase n=1 Tax=Thioclava nitratireducens TaxID=1915078 RepID=A0ABN4XFW4_9RHOB|nr:rhodanese-like domain-containing protein [Thioclava nitratireducens]AQS48914.1 sulfurtransferase [Thioclava nitratireducens]